MIIYTIEKELLMKFKLTNYDPSNYKLLETKLNELSKQGYNCKSVDMFTIFKQDNKRYYYKTDIFVPDKNKQTSNREQRDKWMLEYVEHGYEFIGKSRKIFVFKADKDIKVKETNRELLLNYFKKNRTLLNILLVSISLLLSFSLISSMFFNNSPDEFVTNGSILIHFAPLFLCIGLIVRFFTNYIQTEKIKNALTKKKLPSYNKKNEYLFIISNWLFIFFFIITISGFILDSSSRQYVDISNDMFTLKDFGYNQKSNKECVKSSSLLIDKSYSYFETNNDQSLKINYYYFSSKHKAQNYLENYLSVNYYQDKKEISNGYLLAGSDVYDGMIFVDENKLIVIQTNFDLQENDRYKNLVN